MCVTSAVHDYFGKRNDLWPAVNPNTSPYNVTPLPNYPSQYPQWDRPTFEDYKEILRRLEEIDRKLGQPDCIAPEKEAYMKEVEARLVEIEKRGA